MDNIKVVTGFATALVAAAFLLATLKDDGPERAASPTRSVNRSDNAVSTNKVITKISQNAVESPKTHQYNPEQLSLAYEMVKSTGRWPRACQYIEKRITELKDSILGATPNDYAVAEWRTLVFLTAGCLSERYQEEQIAISLLEKGLAIDPENPQFRHMLATVYFRLGDDHRAEQALQNLLANRETIDALWFQKNAGAVIGKLAVAKFRMATTEITDTNRQRQRLEEAKGLLMEAIQIEGLEKASALRHGQLAYVEMALGNTDLALSEFQTAIEFASKHQGVKNEFMANTLIAEYTMGMGQTLFMHRSQDEGLKKMDEALALAKRTKNTPLIQSLEAIYFGAVNRTEADISQMDTGKIKKATPLEHHSIKALQQ